MGLLQIKSARGKPSGERKDRRNHERGRRKFFLRGDFLFGVKKNGTGKKKQYVHTLGQFAQQVTIVGGVQAGGKRREP